MNLGDKQIKDVKFVKESTNKSIKLKELLVSCGEYDHKPLRKK